MMLKCLFNLYVSCNNLCDWLWLLSNKIIWLKETSSSFVAKYTIIIIKRFAIWIKLLKPGIQTPDIESNSISRRPKSGHGVSGNWSMSLDSILRYPDLKKSGYQRIRISSHPAIKTWILISGYMETRVPL